MAFAARDGTIATNPWREAECALSYDRLDFSDRWLLLTGEERALIDKLYATCTKLGDKKHTQQIYQGLITSADPIYHLERLGPGKYRCHPKPPKGSKKKIPPYEVELEDDVMKPLVSGPEAKRYIEPKTDTSLLFPYRVTQNGVKPLQEDTFKKEFPKAWKYLKSYEKALRARESGKFDDDQWYRFGRHQNLNKQEIEKLIVAQTTPSLRVCYDSHAAVYLNNVRVNGILAAKQESPWFLLGVLNAPVADFVFRRIGKVKAGGYYEANKQFIAPLPIPPANDKQCKEVAKRAEGLQGRHTNRRDLLARLAKRMESVKHKSRPETWLFSLLETVDTFLEKAPGHLDTQERKAWAKEQYQQGLQARYDAITDRLSSNVTLDATFTDGELSFLIDGVPVIENIFLDKAEGAFVLAQWKVLASTFSVTDKTDGKKLCNVLRSLAVTDNHALVQQIIELEHDLAALEAEIAAEEKALNALTYELYGLTKEEIALVEREQK